MKVLFYNAVIVGETDVLNYNAVSVTDGKIDGFLNEYNLSDYDVVLDVKNNYLLPGFVDIHVHGGGGFDFMDGTADAFDKVVTTHLSHGTTTIYPTTMSESFDDILTCLDAFKNYKQNYKQTSNVVGLHLEGPFLSPKMCGAQRPDLIIKPTKKEVDIIAKNAGVIKRISCAPEVDGVLDMAKSLLPLGISFSMGHTNATFNEAKTAYEAGFSSITHLYSATSGFFKVNQKVHIGVTQYAYAEEGIYAELISDTCHVPKELLNLVAKFKGVDKVCMVTDAMRAAGTDVTESYLGKINPKNRVIIEDGVAKLPDRSFFAGSIGTMDKAVRFAIKDALFSISDACKMASLTPATLMGINKTKGSIAVGKDADFVIADKNINVLSVITNGQKVY